MLYNAKIPSNIYRIKLFYLEFNYNFNIYLVKNTIIVCRSKSIYVYYLINYVNNIV